MFAENKHLYTVRYRIYNMNKQALNRRLTRLQPVLFRAPDLFEAYAKIAPPFLKKMKNPLTEELVRHEMDTGRAYYHLTGDEMGAIACFFHDVENYPVLVEQFSSFLREIRSARPSKEKELPFGLTFQQLGLLRDLDEMISPERFRRFHVLTNLDRSGKPILDAKASYEEFLVSLHNEDLARAVCLAQLARIDRKTREKIYQGLELGAQETLQEYAHRIWYVYLPMIYRSGLVFDPFKEIAKALANIVAIGQFSSVYERIRSIKARWHSDLTRIEEEINAVWGRPYNRHFLERLNPVTPFEVNIKEDSMLTIKAVTEFEWKADRYGEDSLRKKNRDTIRARLHLNRGESPLSVLTLACNLLTREGYEIVEPPHQRTNGLYYAIISKGGHLIELQARTPEMHEELERGERYHEGMIGRRLNVSFGLNADENAIPSPDILLGQEARAMVLAAQHARYTVRPSRRGSRLLSIPTTIEYSYGGEHTLKVPVFPGSCVGDVVAESTGLLETPVRVFVDGDEDIVALNREVSAGTAVRIRVDESSRGFSFPLQRAYSLLSDANTLTAQAQCFAVIFRTEFQREQARAKK